jgi:hypothetical protein
MTYKEQAFNILRAASGNWFDVQAIAVRITGACDETIGRALRKMYSEGVVDRKPANYAQPTGRKLWTIMPGAVLPIRASAKKKKALQPSSKGSSGRIPTMCLPANKPTLIAAIQGVVMANVDSQVKFTAHDITNQVRELVNQDHLKVDPAETDTVYVGGRNVPKIDHGDVKEIVHGLFNEGKMNGYDRSHTGQFWEYHPVAATQAVPPSPVTPSNDGSDYDGSSTI